MKSSEELDNRVMSDQCACLACMRGYIVRMDTEKTSAMINLAGSIWRIRACSMLNGWRGSYWC
jgi:hypothetical protein